MSSSHHVPGSRLKQEVRRAGGSIAVAVVGVAVALGCMAYILVNISSQSGSGLPLVTSQREVKFEVKTASGVEPGRDEVRISGIPVGRIIAVKLDGNRAVITARIQSKYGAIYNDARAQLRPATALNEMYLDIVDRGAKQAGVAKGTPIAASRTDTTQQIGDILNTFDTTTRDSLHHLLISLGAGLNGRGDDLRDVFVEAAPLLRSVDRLTHELSVRRTNVKRLVHNTTLLTQELSGREALVRSVVNDAASTMDRLAPQAASIDGTLQQLPATLRESQATFTAVDKLVTHLDPALRALLPAAKDLPAGLQALRTLADTGTPAAAALQDPVRRLRSLAGPLLPAAQSADDAFTQLAPQISAIDHVTKTVTGCTTALQGFFQNNPSLLKFGDAGGVSPRGEAVLSVGAAGGLANDPTFHQVESCSPGMAVHPTKRPAR